VTSVQPRPALHSPNDPLQAGAEGTGPQLDWFRSGPYVGATAGLALADASANDLDEDLMNRGWTTETSFDKTDFGWKAYGGYRFESPFAVELAAVDLGTIKSDISVQTNDIQSFLDDVADLHPFSTKGASLTGTWYPIDERDWEFGLKAGLWRWDGRVDVSAASGESASRRDTGVDVVFGAVSGIDVSSRWSVRAEVEHYRIESNGVTLFTLGAQYTVR